MEIDGLQHVSYQEMVMRKLGSCTTAVINIRVQGRAKYGICSSPVRSQQLVMKQGEMEMDWLMQNDDDSSKSMLLKKKLGKWEWIQ